MTRSWRPRRLGDEAGKGVSEVDDRPQRRFAQHDQDVGLGQDGADTAGELGKQPAGVDHDIGVEPGEGLGDRRPRVLVGGGLSHTGESEQNRKATGELVHVVPHGLGGERRAGPRRTERRGRR